MQVGLRQQWREFRRGPPGHRFQERFKRNQQARSDRSRLTRFLKPIAAILFLVAGVVFCLIPGPGLPLLLIGAGLLADVSLTAARVMDWLEVRIRYVISPATRWWKQASNTAKYAVIVLGAFLTSGAALGGLAFINWLG